MFDLSTCHTSISLVTHRANAKVSTTARGGEVRPILTNTFLGQMNNIIESLSNTKVFKVTKGCLEKLARAKNEMRTQKKIKVYFWSN